MSFRIDHIIVAVRDLTQAMDDYRALGFTVLPGGVHANGATRNALICFEDGTYIELLARTGIAAQPGLLDFSTLLDGDEGLVGYALLTYDMEQEVRRLRGQGIAVDEILPGERRRADGLLIQWRICQIYGQFAPFLIEDVTPRALRVPDDVNIVTHDNKALGIGSITVLVRSLSERSERYAKLLDITPFTEPWTSSFWFAENSLMLYQPHPRSPEEMHLLQQFFDDLGTGNPIQAENKQERALQKRLDHTAEKLYEIQLVYETEEEVLFPIEKTHGLRIQRRIGASRMRGKEALKDVNKVNWREIQSYSQGAAVNVPHWLRMLLSDYSTIRENGYTHLYETLVEKGVSEATLAAIPFLIKLLDEPIARASCLSILGWARFNPEGTVSRPETASGQLWQRICAAIDAEFSRYLDFLDDPDFVVRYEAVNLLSAEVDTASVIIPYLLERLTHEDKGVVGEGIVNALVCLWTMPLDNTHANADSLWLTGLEPAAAYRPLSGEALAFLLGWMSDPSETLEVRLTAALALVKFGPDEQFQAAYGFLHNLLHIDGAAWNVLGGYFDPSGEYQHNITLAFMGIVTALDERPVAALDWLNAAAAHESPAIRAEAVSHLRSNDPKLGSKP